MSNLIPHSFSLHPNHLSFFLKFAFLMVALGGISSLTRMFFPRAPYSLLIVLIWSLLLAITFTADVFHLTPKQFLLSLTVSGMMVFLFSYRKLKCSPNFDSFFSNYLQVNSYSEFLYTLLLWSAGLAILLIPLVFGFPEGTLITGHFISNDSVLHSISSQGISYMQNRDINPFYYSAYPRGIHSLTFYFNSLFLDLPASRIILPAAIASYSLAILAADTLLRSLSVSASIRFLAALLPACAFLPVSAIYTLFLGQVSSVAPVIAAVAISFALRSFGSFRQGLFFLSTFSLGAIATYGLFSVSIIFFGIVLSIFFTFFSSSRADFFKTFTQDFLGTFRSPLCLGIGLFLLLISFEPLYFAANVIAAQRDGSFASGLASSIGNLPEGYLSPFHLSGIWPPGVGYREQLVRNWSALSNVLMFVILLQIMLISRAPTRAIGFLLALAIPCLATAILINSPYVHFKYYTCLIPGFLVVAGAGLDRLRQDLSKQRSHLQSNFLSALFICLLVGFEAFSAIWPLPTSTIIPTLSEGGVASFESVWKTVEGKRTLVLTREDWLQFGAQADDFVPLIIYIPQVFNSNPIDAIVVDRAWKVESHEYLKQFPKLLALIREQKCMTLVYDRFEVYLPSC